MNYVLYHKTPYYIDISFEVLSMYIVWIFIDCLLWTDLISLYKPDDLFIYCIYKVVVVFVVVITTTTTTTCISFSKLILYCACFYVNDKFYIHFGGSLEYWIK